VILCRIMYIMLTKVGLKIKDLSQIAPLLVQLLTRKERLAQPVVPGPARTFLTVWKRQVETFNGCKRRAMSRDVERMQRVCTLRPSLVCQPTKFENVWTMIKRLAQDWLRITRLRDGWLNTLPA
jgi:hypothetical protein